MKGNMICIRVDRQDIKYHILEIARLFYMEDEIVESEPPEGFQGVLIFGCLDWDQTTRQVFRLEITKGDMGSKTDLPFNSNASGPDEREEQKQFKWALKRAVYKGLSEVNNKDLPWGMLTGIRPSKIVYEMMEQGTKREEILKTLQQYYFVSENKTRILYDVAQTERKILNESETGSIGIYIGIPFCPTRCLYCSFTSNPIAKSIHLVEGYLAALKREISEVSGIIKDNGYKIESIYIGGGTPTSISPGQLADLLEYAERNLDLRNLKEYTLEAGRPDSINREKLKAVKNSRVNRISINPQTMNDETLALIGRSHTAADIINAFQLARSMKFDNINMDLIVGLPGENEEMFGNTLRQISELMPESLTVHTMAIKRASILKEDRDYYTLISAQEASRMIDMAYEFARSEGMHPYYLYRQKNMLGNLENIGYCKPGLESIYNIQTMEEKQSIIALGAGAITKVVYPEENRIERAFNVKNVEEYISRLDEMLDRKRKLLAK